MKSIINKKARHEYEFLDEYEAGISLLGCEVKSIKSGHMDISNAYVTIRNGEVFLVNANIPKYKYASQETNYSPLRDRKLLLRKQEIASMIGKLRQRGLTLVPKKVYTKRNRLKLLIVIGKGKTKFDKRETLKKRDAERKMAIFFKQRVRR